MSNSAELKKQAGYQAADMVQDGQLVGLGTGSTVFFTLERLAQRIQQESLKITAVSTSFSTSLICQEKGIPLTEAGSVNALDIAIDGADEIDSGLNLIKGRGAAHVIEKIVAGMAREFVVVADESKYTEKLGRIFPVPVEVSPLARSLAIHSLKTLGARTVEIRMGTPGKDGPIISDSGNLILDAFFPEIQNVQELDQKINQIPGVLGHGIFSGLCTKVILATSEGIKTLP